MSLEALVWLFTVGVAVHNIEEALFLPAWSKTAGRWHGAVGQKEFTLAVAVLTLLLIILAGAAITAGAQSTWANLFTGYVFAMVANVFFPHVLGTIALRRYMPGTVTALLLNLPLGTLFLQQALTQDFVVWRTVVWVAPLFVLGIVASIPMLFALGRMLLPTDGLAKILTTILRRQK